MKTLSLFARTLPFVAPFALVSSATAGVVVAGPGTGHLTLPDAVAAASDGDIILVRTGSYLAGCTIDAKSLTIVADAGAAPLCYGAFVVQNLPANGNVVLQGMDSSYGRGLVVRDCAGSVRVSGCSFVGAESMPGTASQAASVSNSADVAFDRCSLRGALILDGYGQSVLDVASALQASQSNVVLNDCVLSGAEGRRGYVYFSIVAPGSAGGPAIEIFGGELTVSGGSIRGGAGGDGVNSPLPLTCSFGGPGGTAIDVSATPLLRVLDTVIAGGTGGVSGASSAPGCSGGIPAANGAALVPPATPLTTLAGARRSLHPPAPAREGQSALLHFEGQPGDRVYLAPSALGTQLFEPLLHGALLVRAPFRRLYVGTIAGNGQLDVALPVGELGAGVLGRRRHVQGILVDATGQRFVTGSPELVLLDASL